MKTGKWSIQKLIYTAMLAAVAGVLMSLEFSVPMMPPFYKVDFSDVPSVIAVFLMGPMLHALTQRAAVLGSSMAKPPEMQGYVVTIGWFSVKVNRDHAPGFTTSAGVWYHADRNKSANEGGRLCQTPENNRRHSRQKNA